MKPLGPSSPQRSQRGSVAITSNTAYHASKAAVVAALSTASAADAVLSRYSTASESLPLTSVAKRRQTNRTSLSSAHNPHRTSMTTTLANLTKPPATAPANATAVPLSVVSRGDVDVDVFPPWIRERKDFQVFFPRFSDRVITDEEILRQSVPKDPSDRNIVELQCLARWIMKIPSMQTSLDLSQATEIAKLARYEHFKPGAFVFRKGDKGDACYLVFAGDVSVLINGEKVASVGKNTAFGDIALQIENATRGADLQASTQTGVEVLKILADDYHKTLARCQSRRRKHLISWLHTEVAIFRDCVESKLHFFELVSIDVPLHKGQVLYRQHDSVGAFYVVRSGRVRLEVDIQYQHTHRWPCGPHEWTQHVRSTKSRVAFHVEEAGGFFGFEMFVDGQQQRAYTVVAESDDVTLVALNRVDCFSPYFSFTPRAIDKIVEKHEKCRDLATQQGHYKLKEFHRLVSQQKRALKPTQRLPLMVATKFDNSHESPQYQFPRLRTATWDAGNEVVRALQQACQS